MIKRPCHNCVAPKRHVGCHSTCPEFLASEEEHAIELAARNLDRIIYGGFVGHVNMCRAKYYKSHR